MSGPTLKVLKSGGECGAVWLEMQSGAARILEQLKKHGFTALRCVADGEIVVSVYLVSSEQHIWEAAFRAKKHYPHTQRLEVQAVRSSPRGAVTKLIVVLTTQILPNPS